MGDFNAICWRQNRCDVVPIATLVGVRVEKKLILGWEMLICKLVN